MTWYIAGSTAVENARALAQSALPDAPQQQPEDQGPRRRTAFRPRLGAALRFVAVRELRLADRLDPHCDPATR